MSEVTGRLYDDGHRFEVVTPLIPSWARKNFWRFRRRIDAVAFARRKGIRLVTE